MAFKQNKFVIGITGNIGTGKSLVRGMLERLGALGIDADALVHRALLKGSPPQQTVLNHFGNQLQDENGEIDRAALARLVFQNEKALQELEAILHPAVEKATHHLIESSPLAIVVVEAVKLLDSNLAKLCDSIWLVDATREEQLARVMASRVLGKDEVLQRMEQQSSVKEKMKAASVVIQNQNSILDTWKQVKDAWRNLWTLDPRFEQAANADLGCIRQKSEFLELNWDDQEKINAFSGAPNQKDIITRSFFLPSQAREFKSKTPVKKLCDYVCMTNPKTAHPTLLSWMIQRNFILQAGIVSSASLLKPPIALSDCLDIFQYLAEMRACEAIILPSGKYNLEEQLLLQSRGYIPTNARIPVYALWKSEFTKKELTGYNGMIKLIRPFVSFN